MSEKQMENDYRRHQTIKEAVDAADRIILDGSDGSQEGTNLLTAELTMELMHLALTPFNTRMILYHIKKSSERNVVLKAFDKVQEIIKAGCLDGEDEADYLIAEVAKEFAGKALNQFRAKILEKDIKSHLEKRG